MRKSIILVTAGLLMASCGTKNRLSGDVPELTTQIDTLSWAYGQNIASVLKSTFIEKLDAELVLKAALYSLDSSAVQPISDSATLAALQYISFMQNTSLMRQHQQQQASVDEQQEQYFAKLVNENKNVRRHPSGFYYEVIKEGRGPKAQERHVVKFDYRSFLMFTGEPYDQTYGKRDPIVHNLATPMFRGLIDGMCMMSAGSVYRFYFPYQLAFGPSGSGQIPGYTPLIYEVELHEIDPQ